MAIQRFLLLIFLSAGLTKLYAQPIISEEKKVALTQTLYQYANDDSPGMAIGLVMDGEIIYEYYLGYSNLEHKVDIDQATRFNIASCAKQFTAIAVLKLIEEGKIGLEDDFRKYLPDFYPAIQDKIAISDLLMHTSGIRDVHYLWSLKGQTWWQLFLNNNDALALLKSQATLNFKPGTEYLYSNSNYLLLAEIVKEVSGQEFSDFTKTLFLELGMSNTEFLTNYMAIIPNKARPYGNWNGWKEYPMITEIHGDGGLFSTLRDQLKWEQIIQNNSGKSLSINLVNQSQSRIQHKGVTNYGFGLMFDHYGEMSYTYHDGSTGAYQTTFLRFPESKLSVVVMSNNGAVPVNDVAKQLASMILEVGEKDWIYPAGPNTIEELESIHMLLGNYQNEAGTIISIVQKNGVIFRELYPRAPAKLIQEKEGLFYYESNPYLKMNFTNIGLADQQFTIYLSSQEPSSYYKLPHSDLKNFDREELNGSYYNEETDTEITIESIGNNSYSIIKNEKERKAELLLKDHLRMNEYVIRIVRDQLGEVTGLSVENNRIKNVIFERI